MTEEMLFRKDLSKLTEITQLCALLSSSVWDLLFGHYFLQQSEGPQKRRPEMMLKQWSSVFNIIEAELDLPQGVEVLEGVPVESSKHVPFRGHQNRKPQT